MAERKGEFDRLKNPAGDEKDGGDGRGGREGIGKELILSKPVTTSTNEIKAIIWDLGGVLNTLLSLEDWQKNFRALGATVDVTMDQEPFKTLINEYAVGRRFENDEDFLKHFREALKIPAAVANQAVIDAWNSQVTGMNPELYKLVEFLKKFKMFALSNTNKLHINFIETVLYEAYLKKNPDKNVPKRFRDLFDKIYCSHEIGCRKPDPNAWKKILSEVQRLISGNFLFVDDVESYIDVADSLGIHTFYFDINKHSLDDVMAYIIKVNQHSALVADGQEPSIEDHSSVKAKPV